MTVVLNSLVLEFTGTRAVSQVAIASAKVTPKSIGVP